jgi:hypothetical protein
VINILIEAAAVWQTLYRESGGETPDGDGTRMEYLN